MTLKAVVTHQSDSADLADNVTNTFSIGGIISEEDVTVAMELAFNQAFDDFYSAMPAGAVAPVGFYFSPALDNTALASRLDLFDVTTHLDGTPHGSPFSATLFTLDASGASKALPSEVALAVTLEGVGRDVAAVEAPDGADPGGAIDRPKQRRTGRIYLGPLGDNATVAGAGVCRPLAAFMNVARLALQKLNDDIEAATGGDGWLSVWSRADQAMYRLVAVSTDDAFDTQRRRGEAPTARTRLVI